MLNFLAFPLENSDFLEVKAPETSLHAFSPMQSKCPAQIPARDGK